MSTIETPKPHPLELVFLLLNFCSMLMPSLLEKYSVHAFPVVSVAILVALPLAFALDHVIADKPLYTQVRGFWREEDDDGNDTDEKNRAE